MLILGISELDNDSGAVPGRDGTLIGAANEERFTRVKQQPGVPYQAIDWLLRRAGASITDVDRVVVVRQDVHHEYSLALKALDGTQWFSYPGGPLTKALNYGVWKLRNYDRTRKLHLRFNQELLDWIRDRRIVPARIERVNHHLMHAACAYYGSGFEQALAFTVDGQGDGQTATLYSCDAESFDLSTQCRYRIQQACSMPRSQRQPVIVQRDTKARSLGWPRSVTRTRNAWRSPDDSCTTWTAGLKRLTIMAAIPSSSGS